MCHDLHWRGVVCSVVVVGCPLWIMAWRALQARLIFDVTEKRSRSRWSASKPPRGCPCTHCALQNHTFIHLYSIFRTFLQSLKLLAPRYKSDMVTRNWDSPQSNVSYSELQFLDFIQGGKTSSRTRFRAGCLLPFLAGGLVDSFISLVWGSFLSTSPVFLFQFTVHMFRSLKSPNRWDKYFTFCYLWISNKHLV